MWFFIAIVFAFICANIAPSRGKDKLPWFFFGLLTGPIALIVLLLTPKDEVELGYKKCPYCAEYVKPEAIVCKHCNKDLENPRSGFGDTMPCTSCGHKNPIRAYECEDCGHRFDA